MEQYIYMIITSAIGYIIAHYIVKALDNIKRRNNNANPSIQRAKANRNMYNIKQIVSLPMI